MSKDKYYTVGLSWEQVRQHEELISVVDFVQDKVPENLTLMSGALYDDVKAKLVDSKLYIFRQDSRANSNGYNFYNAEGLKLMDLGDYTHALSSFNNAIDYNPKDFFAYNNRSAAHAYLGNYDSAIEDCLKSRDLDPSGMNSQYKNYIQFLKEVAKLTELIANNPLAELYNERGVLFYSQRMFEHAREDFLSAIELDETFAEAHNNLGGVYINYGLFSEAFEHCGLAIALDPGIDNSNYKIAIDNLKHIS